MYPYLDTVPSLSARKAFDLIREFPCSSRPLEAQRGQESSECDKMGQEQFLIDVAPSFDVTAKRYTPKASRTSTRLLLVISRLSCTVAADQSGIKQRYYDVRGPTKDPSSRL